MIDLVWKDDWPPEARVAVFAEIQPLLPLLPPWCITLFLRWGDSKPSGTGRSVAEMTSHYGNRWAHLMVRPPWLEHDPAMRRRDLVHEFLHVALHPYDMQVRWMVDFIPKKLRPLLLGELNERLEMVTEDLARVYVGLKPIPPWKAEGDAP